VRQRVPLLRFDTEDFADALRDAFGSRMQRSVSESFSKGGANGHGSVRRVPCPPSFLVGKALSVPHLLVIFAATYLGTKA